MTATPTTIATYLIQTFQVSQALCSKLQQLTTKSGQLLMSSPSPYSTYLSRRGGNCAIPYSYCQCATILYHSYSSITKTHCVTLVLHSWQLYVIWLPSRLGSNWTHCHCAAHLLLLLLGTETSVPLTPSPLLLCAYSMTKWVGCNWTHPTLCLLTIGWLQKALLINLQLRTATQWKCLEHVLSLSTRGWLVFPYQGNCCYPELQD